MKEQRKPAPEGKARPDHPVVLARGLWLSALCVLVFVVVLCALYIRSERALAMRQWDSRLSAMADDRQAAIEAWLGERWGDARVVASFPTVRALVKGQTADPTSSEEHLSEILDTMKESYGYLGAYILNARGEAVVAAADSPPVSPECLEAARHVAPGQFPKTVLYRGVRTGDARLGVITPIEPDASSGSGWVLLVQDPARWLFPMLQREPTPTASAETLLVREEAGRFLFLSPLRHVSAAPLTFSVPEDIKKIAARAAVEGKAGFKSYVDYREVPIFAATRQIPGTDWGLVVKVDQMEALAEFRERRDLALTTAAGLLLAILGLAYSLWRRQRTQYLREMLRRDERYRLLSEQARDIVLFVRPDGAIIEANAAAERAYGRSRKELARLTVEDLRAPECRESIQADMKRAAVGSGVLFETVHRRKDGNVFPVEVSSMAAEIGGEAVLLSVIRDITERTRTEAHILQLNRLLHTISEINQLVVREPEREGLLSEACRILVEEGEFVMAWVGLKRPDGTVMCVAKAGDSTGYLDGITVRWDETPEGKGPTGSSIREDRHIVNDDVLANPAMVPWREAAMRAGYLSSASFPMRVRSDAVGALTVYLAEAMGFGSEEVNLLDELAGDLGFALEAMEERENRERAEEALRESERQLATLMANLPGMAYRCRNDEDWTMEFVSEGCQALTGYAPEDLLDNGLVSYGNLIHPDDRQGVWDEIQAAVGERCPFRLNYRIQTKDGVIKWVWEQGQEISDSKGEGHLEGFIADVTERKQAEEARRESERRFAIFMQNLPGVAVIRDFEGRYVYLNEAWEEAMGLRREDYIGKTPFETFPREDALRLLEDDRRVIRGGEAIVTEVRLHHPSGPRWWLVNRFPLEGAEGHPAHVAALYVDITERKRAEEALRESEARYRGLFERNLAGVYRSTPEGQLLDCNDAFARIFGYGSAAEILVLPSAEDLYPEPGARRAFIERLRAAGSLKNLSGEGRRKDASPVWLLENVALIRDETRGDEVLEGTCIDVTEQKLAQEKQRLLSTAVEQSHETIMVTDREGRIVYANPAFERITGYGRAEVLGRTPRVLKSGVHGPAFYEEMWRTILAGQVWAGRITNRRKDGKLYEEHTIISPVRDGAGAVTAFVAVKRDVTQEAELEERLREAKRLETVGMIAGGVAHEVRNPLFAITTIVTALARKLADQPEFREYVVHIKDQSRRLNLLMEDLLTLGRPIDPAQFERLDLRDVLAETKAVVAAGGVDAGAFVFERGKEPLEVLGIATKLQQVFANLGQNALSFTPPGGKVRVRARREGEWAVATFADDGPGISPEFMPRLFGPFQTQRKGGTGLGLAIVNQIVKAHGGTVDARNNEPPPGATFTVRLPMTAPQEGRSGPETG